MNIHNKKSTKQHIKKSFSLTRKSLYKAIEFQLLFKTFYIGILIFVINSLIASILDITEVVVESMRIGETFDGTLITQVFDFQLIFILTASILSILYVFLVEKNGVIIITSEYYKNHFISFFRTFFVAMKKTPLFIFRRLRELKIHILIFILIYIIWKVTATFPLLILISTILSVALVIYAMIIIFAILFRNPFTAYITCLEPNESYREFEKNKSFNMFHEKTFAPLILHSTFFAGIIFWIILFHVVIKILLNTSLLPEETMSYIVALFISFTIVGTLIVLSLFKTIRISLLTVLYYEEREKQGKQFYIEKTQKQPKLSRNIYSAIIAIISVALIGSMLLTATIQEKTDMIMTNAHEYISQTQKEFVTNEVGVEDINLQYIIEKATMDEASTLRSIEKVIFAIFAYITIR